MNNEKVRVLLNNYIKENGVKVNYVAKSVGLSESALCRFRHNKRGLREKNLNKILEFLITR